MARHRNVRSMNADDFRYDDDVYGTSAESYDYGASPATMAQYTYDRNRGSQNSPSHAEPIQEEDNFDDDDDDDDGGRKLISELSLSDRVKLDSCLDQMRGVVAESVSESTLVRAALSANFNPNRAINYIMEPHSSSSMDKKEKKEVFTPVSQKVCANDVPVNPALPVPVSTPSTVATEPANKMPPKPKGSTTKSVARDQKSSKYENMAPKRDIFDSVDDLVVMPPVADDSLLNSSSAIMDTPTLHKSASKAKVNRLDPVKEYETRRKGGKDYLNLVVVGHVDAGKSTLMGHVLYKLGFVSQRVMHKYEQEAKKIGKSSFAFAWVLDETEEERSRGVTMDVAQTTFETPSKVITLNDAPGHKDFIPNMITGAAQADVAILVINAIRGEFETGFEMGGQTREHAMLIRSLGVTQVLVAVSKMDKVEWSKERFNEIVSKLKLFFKQTGFKESDVAFVPCSGLAGENLTKPSDEEKFSWYDGPTLVEQIDKFKPAVRPALERSLRLSVTDVFKSMTSGFSLGGIVHAGNIQVGDKVFIAPSNEVATIKNISLDATKVPIAFAGDSVVVSVSDVDTTKITIGSILCDPSFPVQPTRSFRARIVIFNIATPVLKGLQVVLHYQSLTEQAHISQLVCQLHKNTGEIVKKKPRWLDKNSSAIVDLKVDRPVCIELYSACKDLGRFMLRQDGTTIAAGVVTEIFKDKSKSKNAPSTTFD